VAIDGDTFLFHLHVVQIVRCTLLWALRRCHLGTWRASDS